MNEANGEFTIKLRIIYLYSANTKALKFHLEAKTLEIT